MWQALFLSLFLLFLTIASSQAMRWFEASVMYRLTFFLSFLTSHSFRFLIKTFFSKPSLLLLPLLHLLIGREWLTFPSPLVKHQVSIKLICVFGWERLDPFTLILERREVIKGVSVLSDLTVGCIKKDRLFISDEKKEENLHIDWEIKGESLLLN